jgi:hypothetical protein
LKVTKQFARAAFLLIAASCIAATPSIAAKQGDSHSKPTGLTERWQLPPEAANVLQLLYSGDSAAALTSARQIETAAPQNPLGYLLEAEIDWWTIYCANFEFRWNFLDVWHHPLEDAVQQSYLDLASRSISLAEAQLQNSETAEMHLCAGMGYIMRGRLLGLRDDRRGTAHAGVKGREHLMRAHELDPGMADSETGIGLYNYYVDTLSTVIKVLRFFMGIPGGSKNDGIGQLENAMENGQLTAVEARFYLAKNLRTYDREYVRAAELLEPLVKQYPQNPVFAMMLGNMDALLNRKEKAAQNYRAAAAMKINDAACAQNVKRAAQEGLAALSASETPN